MKLLLAALLVLFSISGPAFASDSVHIVPGSTINLVARDARIPVTVMNPSSVPMEVTVYGAATSFRLEVLDPLLDCVHVRRPAEVKTTVSKLNWLFRFLAHFSSCLIQQHFEHFKSLIDAYDVVKSLFRRIQGHLVLSTIVHKRNSLLLFRLCILISAVRW